MASPTITLSCRGIPSATEAKIDDCGRIVIPKEVRDKISIEPGSALEIRVDLEGEVGGVITLNPRVKSSPSSRKASFYSTPVGSLRKISTWSDRSVPLGASGPESTLG